MASVGEAAATLPRSVASLTIGLLDLAKLSHRHQDIYHHQCNTFPNLT